MHQRIQCAGGRQVNELAEGLRKCFNKLEAGLLREINRFQSSCVQSEEIREMQKLDSERRYAELYFYVKGLPAVGAKSQAAMGELNKQLLKVIDITHNEIKKVLSEVAASQHKPAFDAYESDEALTLADEKYKKEEDVISDLYSAYMSTKVKAVYIGSWGSVGDRVASGLASRLQIHPVSALYLAGSNISDAGAEVLAQAAFLSKSLSAFCIESRKISDTGAKAVAKAARNCPSLTALYLSGWEISDSGAIAVAEAVKGCPLSVFYLWNIKISDAGAIAVTDTVKSCPLSAFGLASWKITDSGATAVAKILSNGCASTLFAFYLGGYISDLGAKEVADAIRGCPLLSEFFLDGKPLSGETLAYILDGMAGVSTIRSVNLCIGEVSKERMDSCLDRLQQSGVAKQLKLRFECVTEAANSMCEKFAAEWNAKLAEFEIVAHISVPFEFGVILGIPK